MAGMQQQVKILQAAVKAIQGDPSMMHAPELKFMKDFVESFGGKVPDAPAASAAAHGHGHGHESHGHDHGHAHDSDGNCPGGHDKPAHGHGHGHGGAAPVKPESEEEESEESEESDEEPEEPDEKKVEADEDPGEQSIEGPEWSEENDEKAMAAKQAAVDAMGAGDFAKAAEQYTTALALAPSPLTFAKRADCYLKLKKPNAAIRDCDAALKINPDSAKGFKVRGKAKRLVGDYLSALKDLSAGLNADFDEDTQEWMNEVKPRANRLIQKKQKGERKVAEKELKAKKKRVARARKEYDAQKAAEAAEQEARHAGGGGMGGFPQGGGMPGMPGMPGGGGGGMGPSRHSK